MLVDIAHYSEAVAPQWEADTAAALKEAGDPQYWYTEEQHAFVESDSESAVSVSADRFLLDMRLSYAGQYQAQSAISAVAQKEDPASSFLLVRLTHGLIELGFDIHG